MDMSMSRCPSQLKEQIARLRRCNAKGQEYVPHRLLFPIITYEAVSFELAQAKIDPFRINEIADEVVRSAKCIFSILVLIEKVAATRSLVARHQVRDQNLPLKSSILEDWEEDGQMYGSARLFYDTQWQFAAPIFSRCTIAKELMKRCVLPFVRDEPLSDGRGAFGHVYMVELDEDHQVMTQGFSKCLARKELKPSEETQIEQELQNLARLNRLKHSNIIELLASYKYNDRCNLLFPFADGGDLRRLFKQERIKTPFQDMRTVVAALAGLSSAVERVHDGNLDLQHIGCHHDLRPRNILLQGDTFLLADFGLSRFKRTSEDSKSNFKDVNDDYNAPEAEDFEREFERSRIGRESDIWSFGCILCELLVYLAFGPEGVRQFRDERRFVVGRFSLAPFHCGSEWNPAVQRWLEKLPPSMSNVKLYLVPLIDKMLSLVPGLRPRAAFVTKVLRLILISEILASMDKEFDGILQTDGSLDIALQHWRYQAWKFGFGVSYDCRQTPSEAVNSAGSADLEGIRGELVQTERCLITCLQAEKNSSSRVMALRDLAEHNDNLLNLLDNAQKSRSRTRLTASVLESHFAKSIGQPDTHETAPDVVREIRLLAALKTMTELSVAHASTDKKCLQINEALFTDIKPFSKPPGASSLARLAAESGDMKVLVEWRTYGRKEGNSSINEDLFFRLRRLVGLLKMEKPSEFCSLPCRGFFHDAGQCRFGVVYDLPMLAPHDQEGPLTLQDLIKMREETARQPLLEHKFSLASALAQAVLNFHLVGWLHKDLCSASVLFPRGGSGMVDDLQTHFIIGFNHSRPDEKDAFTDGTPGSENAYYRHPTYQREKYGYRQEYDYYSLGVILLELGLWTSVKTWLNTPSWQSLSLEQVGNKLLETRVRLLGPRMGSAYEGAVRTCLRGAFALEASELGCKETKQSLCLAFQRLVGDQIMRRVN